MLQHDQGAEVDRFLDLNHCARVDERVVRERRHELAEPLGRDLGHDADGNHPRDRCIQERGAGGGDDDVTAARQVIGLVLLAVELHEHVRVAFLERGDAHLPELAVGDLSVAVHREHGKVLRVETYDQLDPCPCHEHGLERHSEHVRCVPAGAGHEHDEGAVLAELVHRGHGLRLHRRLGALEDGCVADLDHPRVGELLLGADDPLGDVVEGEDGVVACGRALMTLPQVLVTDGRDPGCVGGERESPFDVDRVAEPGGNDVGLGVVDEFLDVALEGFLLEVLRALEYRLEAILEPDVVREPFGHEHDLVAEILSCLDDGQHPVHGCHVLGDH